MVLVLVPSYFHFAMDSTTIISFFNKVAHHTPLPVMAYNYPGVTAEIALNAGILVALSEHPNTVGAKLTCGGIGKVPRVTAAGATDQFVVLSGQIDWMGPAMSVGAVGGITGLANLRPRACVRLYNMYQVGKAARPERFQIDVAVAESAFTKGGINGSKWLVAKLLGYPMSSAACRRSYPPFTHESKQHEMPGLVNDLRAVEGKLAQSASC